MRKQLKKYFVPHEENGFKPHFYRFPAVVLMVVVMAGGFFVFSQVLRQLPKSNNFAAIYTDALVYYTNQARENNNEPNFLTNDLLTQAAQMKADDMAAKGYFSHNSPDGKTPWYWISKAGYVYKFAGENLAVNFVDSKDVTDAWMNSPTHRANILNKDLKEVGIATAVGTYKGQTAIFVVQMFGTPAEAPTQEVVAQQIAQTVVKRPSQSAQKTELKETELATTSVPIAKAASVAGVYENTLSIPDKIIASPKNSVAEMYKYFVLLVVLLASGSAVYEFKRHHRSIWLSVLVLAIAAGMCAFLVHYLSLGTILG